MKAIRPGPGRPPKYDRPSRPVTMTLPEDVLARLAAVDADLGRAIVRLVERKVTARLSTSEPAAIANYGNHAVIVVTPVKALRRLVGVELIPIGNGRALISLAHPHSIAQLELGLRDVLERGDVDELERETLEKIADILRQTRGSRAVSLAERTIIVLESKRPRRRALKGN